MVYAYGEIGTSGVFEDIEFDPTNEDSKRSAIAFAIEMEHPCSDSSCDIALALEAGFVYASASLLTGATETPFLNAVCEAAGVDLRLHEIPEWDEWIAYFRANTWECPSCGAFTENGSDVCGNCLYTLYTRRELEL